MEKVRLIPHPAPNSQLSSLKIENPQDDPRSFAPAGNDIPDDGIAGEVPGIDTFFSERTLSDICLTY